MIQLTRKKLSEEEIRIDPVCKMLVTAEKAAALFEYENVSYYFCSIKCYNRFRHNPSRFLKEENNPDASQAEYTCPMHPEVIKIGHGSCPICGMALEPKYSTKSVETNPEYNEMLKRFIIASVLTAPILVFSMFEMFSVHLLEPQTSVWLQFLLSTPVVLWCGFPFFIRAFDSVKTLSPNMFTLIAVGTGSAFLYSLTAVLFPSIFPESLRDPHSGQIFVYFESASVIITLVLFGQLLEIKARMKTSSAISELLNLTPKNATVIFDDSTEGEIPVEELLVGDILRIKANERIPTDGVILEGETYVDESIITGEPIPVYKKLGDKVIGGTLNTNYSFKMKAERVGSETILASIIRLVEEARRSKAPIQNLADKVSAYFVPAVILTSGISGFTWLALGNPAYAFVSAVSVLIIACPCALGLAVPMSIMVGTATAARNGILIKNAQSIEMLSKINTLVVDKTGTLTEGKPTVKKVTSITDSYSENEVLFYAACIEKMSKHPLAKAIVDEAESKGINLVEAQFFESKTGKGVFGKVNGKEVFVQSPQIKTKEVEKLLKEGGTIVEVGLDGKTIGYISLSDKVKDDARSIVSEFQSHSVEVMMITGDNASNAEIVGKAVGIEKIFAEIAPEEKAQKIRALQSEGKIVAMAGDGVNDAPALMQADVGIAFAGGSDVAIETATVTLLKPDLKGVLRAYRLSKAVRKNIYENLFLAFFYNSVSIPIAAGALFPFFGILLSPMIAAAAMTFSSVSVIANALRLKNLKLS
ncbi:MAG: heavy metal translocating P-type ATPase [Pyrinomonadaceae bacterium]|nr:heavy metal translocating P-type ATPase [Pyrinomonadaceae bacterium]MCX7639019.1 heavy metal translocating P-type ATPase [Pyrinomonadaceae bacterium]MDW8303761.1 heavy metal translocating P-type ATPase [Acidobacteriota bacterium]